MKYLTSKIINGHAYRKKHPGCTPKELLHYCTYTLNHDKPDVVIVHVGTNRIGVQDSMTIANDIFEIVKTCYNYGVNQVFVSGITRRPDCEYEINELNNILMAKRTFFYYTFIPNSNITFNHLWKDDHHLNDEGSKQLNSNFITAINNVHA